MKKHNHTPRRTAAGVLAALMIAATVTPTALAAEDFTPACDETYYATLDEYGALKEAGVVKSYRTYGNTSVTDYGKYDEVTNLSNSEEATITDDTVTFNIPDGTKRFYFEGKTSEPFENLPWNLSVSYELNGVPTKAEDLAGSTGVVDITLDATPNENSSEYNRNNLVLIAASMFNGDDLLSLKAPGAQVQLLGNIYCVLYAVLPGEEQHFTISVGSDDFTYDGMIFLAVPATIEQIDKLSDLRDAKDTAEDSYHAISDSLDILINSIDGLGTDMRETADGLDQLNEGRKILEDGLPDVYKRIDYALDDVDDLGGTLRPLEKHLSSASSAFTATAEELESMGTSISGLSDAAGSANKLLSKLREDLNDLKAMIDDSDTSIETAEAVNSALQSDLKTLGETLDTLSGIAGTMEGGIENAQTQIKSVTTETDSNGKSEVAVDLLGDGSVYYTVSEIESMVSSAQSAHKQYEQYAQNGYTGTFEEFLSTYGEKNAAEAKLINTLYETSLTTEYEEKIKLAKETNAALDLLDGDIENVKTSLDALDDTASPVLEQLDTLCETLGSKYLSGHLQSLCKLLNATLEEVKEDKKTVSDLLGVLSSSAELIQNVSNSVSESSTDLKRFASALKTAYPEVKSTLEDAGDFTETAHDSVESLAYAGKSALRLIRSADGPINIGTEDVLESLSRALRRAATGMDQTSTIRNAKDAITSLIEDEWDEHTGEVDNILLMDKDAECESMTDARNEGVASIQYVMRTAEIKHADDTAETEENTAAGGGTFLSRVGTMFSDIWNSITGIFKKN